MGRTVITGNVFRNITKAQTAAATSCALLVRLTVQGSDSIDALTVRCAARREGFVHAS